MKFKRTPSQERVLNLITRMAYTLEAADLDPEDHCYHNHHGYCQAHHLRALRDDKTGVVTPECEVPLIRGALAEFEKFKEDFLEDVGNPEPLRVDPLKKIEDIFDLLKPITERLDILWRERMENIRVEKAELDNDPITLGGD